MKQRMDLKQTVYWELNGLLLAEVFLLRFCLKSARSNLALNT